MKRILPVAVLFAVLLALVIAKETARARLDEGSSGQGELVDLAATKFAAKDAAKLEVTAPGAPDPAYVVEKTGERWLMTKPFAAPAHTGNLEKLIDALASGDAELRADDAGALRDFDLVPERSVQVKLADASGKVLAHLAIGRSTGGKGAFVRFLAQSDTRAFETTADVRGLLGLGRSASRDTEAEAPKPAQFRDHDFPATKVEKAKRIEITAPGRRVALAKSGTKWVVAEGGPGLPVNEQGVERLLEKLGPEFRANDLADPSDLAKLGLAEPKYVVAITAEDGTVVRVHGAGDTVADKWYVRLDTKQDPDLVYEASSWEFNQLFPQGSGIVTFESVDLPDEKFSRFVLERAPAKAGEAAPPRIELVRDGTKASDDWKVVAPDWPLVPRQSSLRSLASLSRNVKAIDWTDAADLGAEEAVVRMGLRDQADADLTTVRIGGKAPTGKDRLAVLPKPAGAVVVLADSTVDRLLATAISLFEPKVLHGWNESDVKAARAEGPAGAFAIERDGGNWTLVRGDARGAAVAGEASKWIAGLLGLETRDPAGDPSAAVVAPVVTATATTITVEKTDGTTRSFALSDPADGRRTVTLGTLSFRTDRADLLPAVDSLAAPAPKEPEVAPEPPKEK